MLKPRIIPCLLIRNKGLIKTQKFKDSKYVGDPLNAVRIFNEKEVDELMVLDIDATREGRTPDFELIKKLASECRMPLCYGGGVKTVDHARRIVSLGAEKVAISSLALENPNLVSDIAKAIGVQSVVVVIDVKKRGILGSYEIMTHNGSKATGKNPVDFAKFIEPYGIGEFVVNSIDHDGMMQGYDLKLIRKIREVITTPLTALGGAGSLNDIKKLFTEIGISGAAAGSLFVFKGMYRAVLISYPSNFEKLEVYNSASIV